MTLHVTSVNDVRLSSQLFLLSRVFRGFANFSVFENDQEFVEWKHSLRGKFILGSRRQAVRVMMKLQDDAKTQLKTIIQERIGRIHISTDHWTASYLDKSQRNFGTLVIRFCDKNLKIHERTIGVRVFEDAKTAPKIVEWIKSALQEYSLSYDDVCVIAVHGPENVCSLRRMVNKPRIWCLNHRLNLVFKSLLTEDIMAAPVAAFKHMSSQKHASGIICGILKGLKMKKLPAPNATCWFASFRMIETIWTDWFGGTHDVEHEGFKMHRLVAKITSEIRNHSPSSTAAKTLESFLNILKNIYRDETEFEEIYTLLKPWLHVFDEIRGANQTFSAALYSILMLMKDCSPRNQHDNPQSDLCQRLRHSIWDELKVRIFDDRVWSSWHMASLFLNVTSGWDVIRLLDAHFKEEIGPLSIVSQTRYQQPHLDSVAKIARHKTETILINKIKKIMHSRQNENSIVEDAMSEVMMPNQIYESQDQSSADCIDFGPLNPEVTPEVSASGIINDVIRAAQAYRKGQESHGFWRTFLDGYSTKYKECLTELAAEAITIPAATASSERMFSATSNHVTSRQNRLAPKTVEMLTFGRKNFDLISYCFKVVYKTPKSVKELPPYENEDEVENPYELELEFEESEYQEHDSLEHNPETTNVSQDNSVFEVSGCHSPITTPMRQISTGAMDA